MNGPTSLTDLQARVEALELALHAVVRHFRLMPTVDAAAASRRQPERDAVPLSTASAFPSWGLKRPRRSDALSWPIYLVLKVAHENGKRRPTAIDVLEAFGRNRPPEVLEVMAGEVKFLSLSGEIKTASLAAIRGRINRMTEWQ